MRSAVLSAALLAGVFLMPTGCDRSASPDKAANTVDAGRCPHDIRRDKCPFCTPSLVESAGACGEHGVPEALCYQCRPYLKTAFRAKDDWCNEHQAPKSQCPTCHPELKAQVNPGAGCGVSANPTTAPAGACPHGIAESRCPFCTPSLVETAGFCKEHDIAEALCIQCRPFLVTAFKAKGDWCGTHGVPESQCVACNPGLKSKPKS